MDSCEIIFKPAGIWLEAILDIFPRNAHINTADSLISLSNGFSGEILDFGHQMAYRPGSSSVTREGLLMARVIRWAYRLYRAVLYGCSDDLMSQTRTMFLYSMKAVRWSSDFFMTLCRCYLLYSGNLQLLGVGTNSATYLHYSDKFHDYMIANNQFDASIYNLTVRWCRENDIAYPRVANGVVLL